MDLPVRAAAAVSGATPSISESESRLTFFDLPSEAQREIFAHCSRNDLVCLSLVSKRFHELAAEQLYRQFSLIFPGEGQSRITRSWIDGLASGLNTLTTSHYNYAKHLRSVLMDTVEAGAKGELAYKTFLYKETCGKFLNNLLYLAIRRARSLETFHWNIRVELSRPVFRELHRLPSLTELCIRMQAGESYWTIPPSLPIGGNQNQPFVPHPLPPATPFSWPWFHLSSSAAKDFYYSIASQPDADTNPSSGSSSSLRPRKKVGKLKQCWSKDPPTLSGFRDLRTLAILDIDNPYTIKELRTCIRRSSSTLTKLKLSFSDAFVARVRMTQEEIDRESSESSDDFHVVLDHYTGPFKEFWKREERKFHEEALGKILGIDPGPPRGRQRSGRHRKQGAKNQKAPVGEGSSSERTLPNRRHRRRRGLQLPEKGEGGNASPEDENAPDGETTGDGADDDVNKTSQTSDSNKLRKMLGPLQRLAESLTEQIERSRLEVCSQPEAEGQAAERQLRFLFRHLREILDRIRLIERELEDAERRLEARTTKANATEQPGKRYVRQTRGLSLESLSIYLISVRPSALAKALNLSCLTQLTLLNAGDQVPIWCMLIRMNNSRPLALRSVFTDHVSEQFLKLVSELQELHELFMLQRSHDAKPQSLVPQSDVTIDRIRRTVLQAHMKTLKRLWINEDSEQTNIWDIDEKTMIFICRWGTNLQELGINIRIHAMHAFLQFFSGLRSLRALNILRFRIADTCQWVMREMRRFIVDNLSYHPYLVLDWMAIDEDDVYQVIRTPKVKMPKSPVGSAGPDKEKEKIRWMGKDLDYSTALGWSLLHPFPSLPSDILGSDDDDDTEDGGKRLNISLKGPYRFEEVEGIKIFGKEIRSGRL